MRRVSAHLKILLAEDHEDDVLLLRQAFLKAGVTSQLHVVNDGDEAIEYLNAGGKFGDRSTFPFPDVLLLDLNLPRRNGFEVLEWVRQQPANAGLVVHVMSASAREVDVTRAYRLGANSYVVKPSRVDELVAFVKALHEWHRFVRLSRLTAHRESGFPMPGKAP